MLPVGRPEGRLDLTGATPLIAWRRSSSVSQPSSRARASSSAKTCAVSNASGRARWRVVNRQVEVTGDTVEAGAAHPGQIAAGQRDRVYPFQWEVEVEPGMLRLIAEKTEIEADIMPDDRAAIHKLVQSR